MKQGTNNGKPCWFIDFGRDANGKRSRRFFKTEAAGQQALSDYLAGLDPSTATIHDLRPGERMALAEILNEIWDQGLTLTQVWADWRAWSGTKTGDKCPDHEGVLDHLILTLEEAGRSPRYLRDLKSYLRLFLVDFDGKALSTITHNDILRWLRDRGERGQTRASNLGRLGSLFSHAVRQGWIAASPMTRIQRETVEAAAPQILTLEQCRSVCRYVVSQDAGMGPWLGLCLFAGLRPDEARQVRREAITDAGEVIVEGVTSKVRQRRVVTLHPTALDWIQLPHPLPCPNVRRRRRALAEGIGLYPWPQDILRHTAATHLLTHYGSAEKTALELGNSSRILQRHYRGLATRADSEAFWGLTPQSFVR